MKIVCGIIVGLLILIIAVVVLNMHTGKTTIETTDSVEQTSAVDVSTDGFMNII